MTDARFAVRDALRALLAEDPSAWPGATPQVFRGRLLDRVGSDARPLVVFLASVAERGVHARLHEAARDGMPLARVRGPLVVSLTQEHFLQPEMAQWAVETWAFALGVAPLDLLTPGIGRPLPAAAVATPALPGPAGAVPTWRGPAAPPAALRGLGRPPTGQPRAPYRPPNAPPGFRPGRPAVGPLGVRGTPGLTPTFVRRTILGVGAGCVIAIAVFVATGPHGERVVAPAAPAPSSASPPVESPPVESPPVESPPSASPRPPLPKATTMGVPRLPTALPGLTDGALPASRADSGRIVFVTPPVRAMAAQEALPSRPPGDRPGLGPRNVGTGAYDRVILRSGEVLVGRVELMRASEVQLLDAETRLRRAISKREIREIITEFGSRVSFSAEARRPAPVAETMGPLVRRGVGGAYLVTSSVRSVVGSPECRGLWTRPPPPLELFVTHVPGADTLQLRATNGGSFPAVLDAAANFSTSLLPQPEASVGSSAITTRMAGRFSADGFTAEFTIIGYRRQPTGRDITCTSVLDARGARRGG